MNAEPSGAVKKGNKLTLECIVSSSNPAVLSYLWLKDGESWSDWLWDSRKEFNSLKETDSGNYSCKAKNEIGIINSERLTIDVQCELIN